MKSIRAYNAGEKKAATLCSDYRELYDYAPVGYFTFDSRGTIESLNHTGAQMLVHDEDHLLRRSFLAFIARNDWNIFLTHLRNVFAKQLVQTCEIHLKRADRTFFPVELRSMAVADRSGIAQYCRTIVFDIIERKEIRVLGKWLDIFNNTQIGIVVVSADGKILELMNPALATMHGYSVAELTGKATTDIIAPSELKKFSAYARMAQIKGFQTCETLHLRKDGSLFPAEATVTAVRGERKKILYWIINVQDITERKQMESKFQQLSRQHKLILEAAGEGIFGVDTQGNNTIVNKAASAMLGYKPRELIGKHSHSLYHHTRPDGTPYPIEDCPIYAAYRDGAVHFGEEVFWKKDGTSFPIEFSSRPLFENKSIIGAVVTFRDITKRKHVEGQLRKSKEFSDALNSIDAMIHSTLKLDTIMGKVLAEAARIIEMDGSSIGIFQEGSLVIQHAYNIPEELADHHFSPEELQGIREVLWQHDAIAVNDLKQGEGINIPFWQRFGICSLLAAPLMIRKQITGALSFYSLNKPSSLTDIHIDFIRKLSASLSLAMENAQLYEERRRVEETMRHMAHHDTLTGLANRSLLMDIIPLELAKARRNQKKVAILFLDLDRFKEVNDTLGHEAGDDLLKEVADRITKSIRASDTVARIGGDEFNVILANVTRSEDIGAVAQEILNAFKKPCLIGGHYLHMTTSIGISIYPDDNKEIDNLFRYADIAMYNAKEQGGNAFRFYSHDINIRSRERLRMESHLRHTIERGELTVHYQPQVDIKTGSIFCAEALIRWNHPAMGLLLPKRFIPLAEETGFITTIDEWLLRTVCAQRKAWLDEGMPNLCVTVNLSARQFQHPEMVGRILHVLEETGLPPACLVLEITETMAMSNVEHTAKRLKELTEAGVGISIDDFGTGYSSLNYLKRLPIYQLKIDQSFVNDIVTDPDDRAIVTAVAAMAHSLKMRVIAEGVETEEQLSFLRSIDCDEAQGFFFSRPLPADEFKELIASAGGDRTGGTACPATGRA